MSPQKSNWKTVSCKILRTVFHLKDKETINYDIGKLSGLSILTLGNDLKNNWDSETETANPHEIRKYQSRTQGHAIVTTSFYTSQWTHWESPMRTHTPMTRCTGLSARRGQEPGTPTVWPWNTRLRDASRKSVVGTGDWHMPQLKRTKKRQD